MNLLKGSEDLSWYVGHWGDERGLIFVRVTLSLPCFFSTHLCILNGPKLRFNIPRRVREKLISKGSSLTQGEAVEIA